MRNVTPAALTFLQTKQGTEPINVLQVAWTPGGPLISYADRDVPSAGLYGRILEIGTLENVINIAKNQSTQSLSIKLDDIDGSLKQIFNQVPIVGVPVAVYQYFDGMNPNDMILLFTGVIVPPIEWSEGDQTLSFDVISKLHDQEVGFSPEQGQFTFIPEDLIGKAWPMCFGQVFNVPAVQADKILNFRGFAQALNSIGKADPSLAHQILQLENDLAKEQWAAMDASAKAADAELAIIAQGGLPSVEVVPITVPYVANSFHNTNFWVGYSNLGKIAAQWRNTEESHLTRIREISAEIFKLSSELLNQIAFERQEVSIINAQLLLLQQNGAFVGPPGEITLSIGGLTGTGTLTSTPDGSLATFILNSSGFTHPDALNYNFGLTQAAMAQQEQDLGGDPIAIGKTVIPRNKFFFVPGGANVQLFEQDALNPGSVAIPIRYIANIGSFATINAVWAYQQPPAPAGGVSIRKLTVVPQNYYTVTNMMFGNVPVTMVTLKTPLSFIQYLPGIPAGWEDNLYIDLTSPIGPNTVDIMIWMIQTFTNLSYDVDSFNHVRSLVDGLPSNFCFRRTKNIVDVLSEIAFQARCAIWLNNGIFYLKFLPELAATVDTLTEADIAYQSLIVETTKWEDLVTVFRVTWREDYDDERKDFELIVRNNIPLYGAIEKKFDCYIYTNFGYVQTFATFWLIRMSNIWKRLKCKTYLNKLRLENFDMVNLNFASPYIANGPVPAMVEVCQYESANNLVNLELWVPVRVGEMDQYPWAMPLNIPANLVFPYFPNDKINIGSNSFSRSANTGQPLGTKANGDLPDGSHDGPYDNGGMTAKSEKAQGTPEIVTTLINVGALSVPIDTSLRPPDNPYSFNVRQLEHPQPQLPPAQIVPAQVMSGGPGQGPYVLNAYYQGINAAPTQIQNVTQLQIDPNDVIPPGTWVFLVQSSWYSQGGDSGIQLNGSAYIQVPVWLSEQM